METSLPFHYQDYHQPYACGVFFQHTDNTYNAYACQYPQSHQAMLDWQSPFPDYHSLHSSHPKFLPHLRFHMPAALKYSQPQRGWRGRRAHGRAAGRHTIANMSPPTLTRCVSTLSSPFITDSQLTVPVTGTDTHCSSSQVLCGVPAANPDVCSTHPSYVNTTLSAHGFLNWLDCSLLEHPEPDLPALSSDHICHSLVDMSQRPAALNDAICMYIDYLTRDNDRVMGQCSVITGDRQLDTALSTMVNDQLYRDLFCQPSSFPTSRFREWLQIYSVDLEITDPEGRKLTEATFPGCGCEVHQMADSLVKDLTSYRHSQLLSAAQNSTGSWSQHSDAKLRASTVTVPRQSPVLYSGNAREMHDARSRRGRGRGTRQPGRGRGSGRGRGRGVGTKRHSETEYNTVSHHRDRGSGQLVGDVTHASLSTVDTECNDDSAVVEFLASLQSDAVKRRSRQQQLESQQQQQLIFQDFKLRDDGSHCENKVIEEVVNDELQMDESGPARYQRHRQQVMATAPQSYVNWSVPTRFTSDHLMPASCPAVNDPCSMPVKAVDVYAPSDMVGKSSEQ